MKLKSDFVTNSSSSSFVIKKKHLTKKQIMMIHDHMEIGKMLADYLDKKMYYGPFSVSMTDQWSIEEYSYQIEFDVFMDNFDMWWFLKEIGVKNEHIPPREN